MTECLTNGMCSLLAKTPLSPSGLLVGSQLNLSARAPTHQLPKPLPVHLRKMIACGQIFEIVYERLAI